MKTVRMVEDFNYRAKVRKESFVVVKYIGGNTYRRVPEAAVEKILESGSGEVVDE